METQKTFVMKKQIINLFVFAGLLLATTACNNKNEPQIPDICDAVQARDFQKVTEITNKFLATLDNSLNTEVKMERLKNWLLEHDCVESVEPSSATTPQESIPLDITFGVDREKVVKVMVVNVMSKPWRVVILDINPPSPLINKTWKLIGISGEGKPNMVDNYAIIFHENGTVEFPLFCNVKRGNYVVDTNSFVFGYGDISFFFPDERTELYCGELYDLENFVTKHLSRAVMYSVQGNNLTIECEDGVYLLFEAMQIV